MCRTVVPRTRLTLRRRRVHELLAYSPPTENHAMTVVEERVV
jgi:hypothetical protein